MVTDSMKIIFINNIHFRTRARAPIFGNTSSLKIQCVTALGAHLKFLNFPSHRSQSSRGQKSLMGTHRFYMVPVL
jgi:hypothetical protein